ncbi:class I SAM-dependent methyltransferase [Nocardioides sp. GY 10113]|uniref:class I SAM-dependent methyltransferase n=1 Tax=Nocardioides sp. GY 10113 TaxID=2569761 RepID=UPI0010A7FE09|nr:class I SAM-dependent methyltransferase [Nocardioides sp. GY 10113]TIC85094.1 class I SAM-dependent methyltransferase [Nocardioides sp. GY 10113]
MSDQSHETAGPAEPADPARSFGSVVDAYERGRPDYPLDAVRWLTGDQPLTVLELGAGTGKLTRHLVDLGHDVHATDPDPAMLDRLARSVRVTRLSQTAAEEIPAPDAAFDLVVVGQAYHWFDKERALPEIARVLKRGGELALVWNVRDERVPWVRRLGNLIGRQDVTSAGPDEALHDSPYFGPVQEATFKHWQVVDRVSIQDLVLSRSNVATLPAEEREALVADVLDFYDDYGRGMDGMQLPYLTQCYRAVVGIRPRTAPPAPAAPPAAPHDPVAEETQPVHRDDLTGDGAWAADPTGTAERSALEDTGSQAATQVPGITEPPTDDDSGVLLIDFR